MATNYSPQELEQLAARVRARILQDERYAYERQEAYRAKRKSRVIAIINEVVIRHYGRLVQSVVEAIKRRLPSEWFA
jgi:hypothetical protein